MSKRRRNKEKKKTLKPFCYYCDREFDDLRILIEHQKAKHFKCPHCPRRLVSVSGMITHVTTVHKMQVMNVPNAKDDRDQLDFDVVGMEGIPVEFLEEKYDGEIPEEIAYLLPSLAHKRAKSDDYSIQHSAATIPSQPPLDQPPLQPGLMGAAPVPPSFPPHPPQMPGYMGRVPPPPVPPHFLGGPPMPGAPPPPYGMPPPGHLPPYGMHPPPFGLPPPPPPYGMPVPPFMPPPLPPQPQPSPNALHQQEMPFAQSPSQSSAPASALSSNPSVVTPLQQMTDADMQKVESPTATFSTTPSSTKSPTPSHAEENSVVMIYADQEMSMEEKRSILSRYRIQIPESNMKTKQMTITTMDSALEEGGGGREGKLNEPSQ